MEPLSGGNILKEISNSPPNNSIDNEERRLMRNPFAVKNKAVDNKCVKEDTMSQCDKGETQTMREDSDSVSTLPSSQLSLYSIDAESLTFSSQDITTESPNLNTSSTSLRTQESSNLSQSPNLNTSSTSLRTQES